jgi:hypothetical protein
MSKQSELDRSYQKGVSDGEKDAYHPPSSDSLKSTIDTMTGVTTVDQRDSAYNAGHSDAGREKK